jgi:glycolate oxidase
MGAASDSAARFDPRRARRAAEAIARRIGETRVVLDPDVLESYAGDESTVAPVAPAAVVRAKCAEDVRITLEVAADTGVPVTPRGAGTGKSGGAVPVCGGIVLATQGLARLLDVDRENLVAVAEPGLVTGRLHEAVEAEGLFYPPDPASLETCCLGGNVAENAGGPRAFKYGVTSHYVLGLEAVLPGGQVLQVGRRTVKGVAGYDVTSLLVGSEGTLAVFTRLVLRLVPRPPAVRTVMGLFADPVAAGAAVSRAVELGLVPRTLELLDGLSLDVLRLSGRAPIPQAAGAMLLVEVDGDEASIDRDVEGIAAACESRGAIDVLATRTAAEARVLWEARRELSTLLGRRRRHKLADDVVVPRREIAALLRRAEAIGARRGVEVACYGHAGDGNLHVNVLWDDGDPARAAAALEDVARAALDLGGTITGEHGVGAAKRHLLGLEQSEALISLQKHLKAVFDPRGILNPGKIFP